MQAEGKGKVLDQFANPDNLAAHYETTGPEVWQQTEGEVTHFMCSLGTTGTIMGVSKYLKEQNPAIQMMGVYPAEGSQIPGIRKWAKEYEPAIFDESAADELLYVSRKDADDMAVRLGREEGIFAGISSGATLYAALELSSKINNATIVIIICDRGDRYISTGIYDMKSN